MSGTIEWHGVHARCSGQQGLAHSRPFVTERPFVTRHRDPAAAEQKKTLGAEQEAGNHRVE